MSSKEMSDKLNNLKMESAAELGMTQFVKEKQRSLQGRCTFEGKWFTRRSDRRPDGTENYSRGREQTVGNGGTL